VRGFLDALGVPPRHIPNGLDAQAALYRSLLAGRRVLVLLDNAAGTDQVRPLLPGSPGCLTIVTSRNQLHGLLAAYGAHALSLRPLDVVEAREFLARRLGDGRVSDAPEAVAAIAERCAGLPLALACVAARVGLSPDVPLSVVADELRETRESLEGFTGGE
ncbi:NB-ARC domain-containing protein, partial [Streptomyces sp. MCAF7]